MVHGYDIDAALEIYDKDVLPAIRSGEYFTAQMYLGRAQMLFQEELRGLPTMIFDKAWNNLSAGFDILLGELTKYALSKKSIASAVEVVESRRNWLGITINELFVKETE